MPIRTHAPSLNHVFWLPETQFWQLVNLGSSTYYTVNVDGHEFTVLENDGTPAWKSNKTRELFFVQGGSPAFPSLGQK